MEQTIVVPCGCGREVEVRLGIGINLSASVKPEAWSPARLSGLDLWLTAGPSWCFADAAKTIPCGDGDPVYTWTDRSGTGELSQATLAKRPVLRLDAGGKWYVDFDGSDDWIGRATGSPSNTHSLYYAGRSGGAGGYLPMWNGSGSNFAGWYLNGPFDARVAHQAGDVVSGVGAGNGEDHSLGYTCDNLSVSTYRDGVAGNTGTFGGSIAADSLVRLGANASGTQNYAGRIYGVVLAASVPSAADRASLDAFLAALLP